MNRDEIVRALPLKPAWFHILLTLAEGPTHGYAIRKAVEARTNGRQRLWPATLYGALSDMTELKYIREAQEDVEPADNLGRIRYRLTELGDRVLEAEVRRLEDLVHAARAARAAGSGPAPA